ncbi:MAG: hypothetical protein KJ888_20380 [Gammaproteobacteria bacterium]|uniref:Uncharacterized protein n=1 Tax=viral metagenome TaxID=1070528 RepID=A0A6M3KZL9_9ZZZZ|nr:hypothetical protein [Gammaproteobacteria bacterium]MBU2685648.1 hypothetical protein [Gammaproteobacteria bacterium]
MKYTLKLHKYRLRIMLKKPRPQISSLCPAMKGFEVFSFSGWIGDLPGSSGEPSGPCKICQEFIGIKGICPCVQLGTELAIERTLELLDE